MLKKKIESTKNFVRQNKTKILITTTVVTSTVVIIQKIALNRHNEFLKDRNLYEEFYAPEE